MEMDAYENLEDNKCSFRVFFTLFLKAPLFSWNKFKD